MLSIAEVCPASMQCRMRLNQKRNDQRRQSVWLYKVVEVGAGTNFIVDQLLQTRAGENIVAMMSGLAPLLPKSAFNTATLYVFQKRDAPSNSIPGLAQLEKFRDTILPLASELDTKDKVFQYHKWMLQLLGSDQSTPLQGENSTAAINPYTAMPDPETIANVICYLSKLAEKQDEVYVLVYHGLQGAAWVAAYAQDVLGLPVCMFVNESMAVPLSGDHISARIILRLYSGKQTCELRRVGKVEDFIKVQNNPTRDEKGWVIDARTTKYYTSQRSVSIGSVDHIYTILASSLVSSYVKGLASSLNRGPNDGRRPGLTRFAVARLPLLRKQAFANMRLLGFDCTSDSAVRYHWRDFFACRIYEGHHLVPSQLWVETFGSALLESHGDLETTEMDFNADGQDTIDFLLKAVNCAATLAFTNWGEAFCGISVRYLNSDWRESWLSEETRPLLHRDPMAREWRDPALEMLLRSTPTEFDTIDILRYAISITTDTVEDAEIRRFLNPANGLIAISCEGLVMVRAMGIPDVGAIQKIELLSFYPGAIICEDESLTCIKSESSSLETSAELVTRADHISPSNAVQDLKVVSRSLIERHEVLVETQIMLGSECCQLADPVAISEMIPQILVSDECSHGYNKSYQVPQRIKTTDKRGEEVYLAAPVWQGGLSFQSKHRPASMRARPGNMKVYVQSVDGNPIGQWLACQWTSDWDPFAVVLQEHSCLECIFEAAKLRSFVELCIINGGAGAKSQSHPTNRLRAPNRDRNRPHSADHGESSTTEHAPNLIHSHLSIGGDSGERIESSQSRPGDQSPKPQNPLSFEEMGVPLAKEVPKKSWAKFGRSKQKDPC